MGAFGFLKLLVSVTLVEPRIPYSIISTTAAYLRTITRNVATSFKLLSIGLTQKFDTLSLSSMMLKIGLTVGDRFRTVRCTDTED